MIPCALSKARNAAVFQIKLWSFFVRSGQWWTQSKDAIGRVVEWHRHEPSGIIPIGEHGSQSVWRTRFEALNGMHARTEHHISRPAFAHATFGCIRRRKKDFDHTPIANIIAMIRRCDDTVRCIGEQM